jgi:hypothetical protein
MEISSWAKSVTDTIKHDMPTDSELADVVADLQTAERTLAECRRMLLSELTGPISGRRYRIVETRQAKRSYNTSGLLAAFGGFGALPELVAQDAVRISWQWTNLQRAAQREDVTLSVAQHEIDDGDEALVGETWNTRWAVEPKR